MLKIMRNGKEVARYEDVSLYTVKMFMLTIATNEAKTEHCKVQVMPGSVTVNDTVFHIEEEESEVLV